MKHIIVFLFVIGILIALLWRVFPDVELGAVGMASLAQLGLVGTMVMGSIVFLYQRKPARALQHGLVWVVIAFVCVALYASKDSMLAVLVPGNIQHKSAGVLAIRAAADGHFYLNAAINGKPVRFMIDTGASSITLPMLTAKRLGFAPENLAFTQSFNTANGQVFGAPITLNTLEIGGHIFEQVPAFVNQGELGTPLMGLRFLNRAQSVEIREDELIIRF